MAVWTQETSHRGKKGAPGTWEKECKDIHTCGRNGGKAVQCSQRMPLLKLFTQKPQSILENETSITILKNFSFKKKKTTHKRNKGFFSFLFLFKIRSPKDIPLKHPSLLVLASPKGRSGEEKSLYLLSRRGTVLLLLSKVPLHCNLQCRSSQRERKKKTEPKIHVQKYVQKSFIQHRSSFMEVRENDCGKKKKKKRSGKYKCCEGQKSDVIERSCQGI